MVRSFERAEAQLQSAISKIVSRRNVLNCRKNEVIFSQGDLAESLFYIQAGRVKLSVVSPSGKEATLSVFTKNDLIGRGILGVLEFSKRRLGTAMVLEPSELIRIDRDSSFKVLREQPELLEVVLAHLSNRNNRTSKRPVRPNS